MKKWLRRLLIAAEIILFLLAVWFEPTCIVRGTLRGEAFYEGKPTSWWRIRVDRWRREFSSDDEAISTIPTVSGLTSKGGRFIAGMRFSISRPPPTLWEQIRGAMAGEDVQGGDILPAVLQGWEMDAAEPVLRELAADAKYHAVAERALDIEKR